MFEKLLATLPYNPGLASQVAFYGRRMREESTIRRTGLIFIVLAFFVQFFAVLSPPQPSVAASNNDLINGGISSAADAANQCNNNTQHYQNILSTYGITCGQVANAQTVNINSSGQNYYSFGRNPQGFPSEQPVNIANLGTIYVRKLSAWGNNVPYRALQLTAQSGKTFWILYQCGNLVSIGVPSPYTPSVSLGNNQPVSSPVGIAPAVPVTTPRPAPAPAPTPTTPTTPVTPLIPPKDCEESISSRNSTACLAISKSAANTTQNLADANNSTAQAGDVIVYTLHAKNTGTRTIKKYVFQENLSDVMDYANITDLHGGSLQTPEDMASWPAVDIKGGETATEQITVTVKNPVPQTPVSASDPTRFDLTMTNVYGNAINIHLPGSPQKTIETATTSLPNTGPGTSLFIGSIVVVAAGYFYGRSRLLAKESVLALKESTTAGSV